MYLNNLGTEELRLREVAGIPERDSRVLYGHGHRTFTKKLTFATAYYDERIIWG